MKILVLIIIVICVLSLLGILVWLVKGLFKAVISAFLIVMGIIGMLWLSWKYVPELKAPGNSIIETAQGKWAELQSQFPEAKLFYQKALPSFPYRDWVYEWLGDLAVKENHPDKAIQNYQQALLSNESDQAVRLKLAHLEWQAGRTGIALGLYQDALQAEPNNIELYENIGDLYLKRAQKTQNPQDYEQATHILKPVFQKHPDEMTLGFNLAEMFFNQHKYDEALETYCILAVKNPTNPEAYYSTAIAMQRMGAPKSASDIMRQAAELIAATDAPRSQHWAQASLQFHRWPDTEPPARSVTVCLNNLKMAANP